MADLIRDCGRPRLGHRVPASLLEEQGLGPCLPQLPPQRSPSHPTEAVTRAQYHPSDPGQGAPVNTGTSQHSPFCFQGKQLSVLQRKGDRTRPPKCALWAIGQRGAPDAEKLQNKAQVPLREGSFQADRKCPPAEASVPTPGRGPACTCTPTPAPPSRAAYPSPAGPSPPLGLEQGRAWASSRGGDYSKLRCVWVHRCPEPSQVRSQSLPAVSVRRGCSVPTWHISSAGGDRRTVTLRK